jgi:hypothetical protein
MKKIMIPLLLGALSLSAPAWADNTCASNLPQVSLQLTAEEWVVTQTARVSIALDGLLNKKQLASAQEDFQTALKNIAPEGNWHITEFSRTPSKTSLEQLHAVAEARLTDKALAGLRDRVHAQNSEGLTYTVQEIIYSPTTAEIAAAKAKLRAQIYDQAKAELDRFNSLYPKPGYNLYQINFVNPTVQPGPMLLKMDVAASREAANSPMSLSQQLTQDALVIFAVPPGGWCENHRS